MSKFLIVALVSVLLIALLIACFGYGNGSPGSSNIRQMTVTGNGRVYLTPDVAYINIGVHTEASDVTEALNGNTAQAQAVAAVLTERGVDPKDIQTTAFNVYPSQQYGPEGQPLEMKYVVDNTVYVTVRDLSRLGELLDAVVKSGANNITGIQFDIANKEQAMIEARQKAVEDARKQAEELTAAAGVKLGKLMSISIYSSGGPVPVYDAKGGSALAEGTSQVPVSAGQMIISVDVGLTYAIK